jgi:hypothetical protein
MKRLLPLLLLPLLTACPAPEGPQPPSCEVEDEFPEGELHATVDGDAWVADNTMFQVQATGMMLGFTVDATNAITMRLTFASHFSIDEETEELIIEDGDEIQDVHDDRTAPSDFLVGDGSRDGADATLVVDSTTMHSSNADEEGFLRLVEYLVDEDTGAETLIGCGWFDAEEQNGDQAGSVTDLSFAVAL